MITRWPPQKRGLYELVVRHFLACVSKAALGQKTVVEADVAGEEFTARGLMVLERNYLDIYRCEPIKNRKKITLPLWAGGRVSPMGSWGSWGTPWPYEWGELNLSPS
eukprot:163288-Prorocentrum_minimum.AAC.3